MWVARVVTTLVLTAHGSEDPRSAANARAVAGQVARMRPDLDVRLAFCELNAPNLIDVLNGCSGRALVTPLLLADAYHARVDIPAQIERCGAGHRVRQAGVLGEDDRLVAVRALAAVAPRLLAGTRWACATTAFVTRPEPSLAEAADRLRRRGARRVVIAPWFLAAGRLPDRVRSFADDAGIAMAQPLGAHQLVAETVLDRFAETLRSRCHSVAA